MNSVYFGPQYFGSGGGGGGEAAAILLNLGIVFGRNFSFECQ